MLRFVEEIWVPSVHDVLWAGLRGGVLQLPLDHWGRPRLLTQQVLQEYLPLIFIPSGIAWNLPEGGGQFCPLWMNSPLPLKNVAPPLNKFYAFLYTNFLDWPSCVMPCGRHVLDPRPLRFWILFCSYKPIVELKFILLPIWENQKAVIDIIF
jgi:hypothetical protein